MPIDSQEGRLRTLERSLALLESGSGVPVPETDTAALAAIAAHLADLIAAHGAAAISVDSSTLVGTGTTVQAVFEELDDAIAALTGGGGLSLITTEFGFVGNGTTVNDDMLDDLLDAIDGETTSCTFGVPAGIYRFSVPHDDLARSGVHFLRLIGQAGMPFFNQTPDGDMMVVFKYDNASASTFLDIDPGSGSTLQSGVYLENINLWNTGHADNVAVSVDRTNNWRLNECGWQGWGTGVVSESNLDNAHGKLRDCMMNIPAGKVGVYVLGGEHGAAGDDVDPTAGGGFSLDGGSYSGDTDSVCLYGGPYADAATLEGDVKADGTTHGGVVWNGTNLHVNGARFERCGDATHPAIDIKHDAARANSGSNNQIALASIVGAGSELSGRFDTGSFGNAVSSMVTISNCTSGWVDNGTWNIVSPQLFNMPSSASYPVQLSDGSTLAQTIDNLQQQQLVKP